MGKQRLRVCLLKDGLSEPEQICRTGEDGKVPDEVTVGELRDGLGLQGFIATKQHSIGEPKWWPFVGTAASDDLEALQNSSASALIVVEAEGRCFAFTFGYGCTLLREEVMVRDFGFRVTLNRVNPDDLRCIDTHTFEEMSVSTRRQTSRGASFGAFGIDATRDLMRTLTGKSKDAKLGDIITGSDALSFAVDTTVAGLPQLCRELLSAYDSEDYKQDSRFDFVDKVRPERDKAQIAALDERLLQALTGRQFSRMHLCPPEPLDWGGDIEGFAYTERRNEAARWDLDPQDLVAALGDNLTIERLGKRHVHLRSTSGNRVKSWTAYDCIVFETSLGEDHFALTHGDWFRIQPDFVMRINKQTQKADEPRLPDTKTDQPEEEYNKTVSGDGSQYVLFDRKCPTIDGDKVEVCDLLSIEPKRLVHVKRWSCSGTLSHLFNQGLNSAICLVSDETYRAKAREVLMAQSPAHVDLIPAEKPNPADYEVVFAVAYPQDRNFPQDLPFFTKLNLVNTIAHLDRMGFRASLVQIKQV